MKNSSSYFQNRDCGFFPCHKTGEGEYFNCLFCFCPLYTLGNNCGGNFVYTDKGIKDCSNCTLPHSKKGYEYINERFPELSELAKQKRT